MRGDDVREALDYLYWVRDRVLDAAARLSDDEFAASQPATTRTLREILAHQLECEWAWRVRLANGAFPDGDVVARDFHSAAALMNRWRDEERELRALVGRLDDDALAAVPMGRDNSLATWRYLMYVVNHGTQQFSEAAVLLTRAGHSPGEIGYLEFCLQGTDAARWGPHRHIGVPKAG